MGSKKHNILDIKYDEALDFFLQSNQYHGCELPEYFNFNKVLEFIKGTIGDKKYEKCLNKKKPENSNDVNLDILMNKDGHYAVRPIILANPYLYYFLAREICSKRGWNKILNCFEAYQVPNIYSCALPVIPNKKESFHKSTTIINWWKSMEQRSIELSLEFRYMFVTDITNCYGSINPQSIEWALNCRNTEFENDKNTDLANNIQKYLQALQHGHNIGIPQGSALFDMIAEIILGYADLLLHEKLKKGKVKESDYKIIRYRDDYRVFCNKKDILEKISYTLQEVLETLNFRMNSQKTKISESIVTDSIKSEKLDYIYNTPILSKKGCDFNSFEKHLLFILMFGRKHPNCGQLKVLLSEYDKRLTEYLKPIAIEEPVEQSSKPKTAFEKLFEQQMHWKKQPCGGSVRALSAIATQIALENVVSSHYALRIVSRLIDTLTDEKEKWDIIDKVYDKLAGQPNSIYNQIWLQNITYQQDKKKKKSPYTMRLCKLVTGDYKEPIWNNDWLRPEFTKDFPYDSIVDKETLKNCTPIITFRENRDYYEDPVLDYDEEF